jgi:hypothetical protein
MAANPGGGSWIPAVLFLFALFQPNGIDAAYSKGNVDARATTRPAAVVLEYFPRAPELSRLKISFPSIFNLDTRLGLRYFHPLVQSIGFSNQHCGPEGRLLLPGNRQYNSELIFFLRIAGQRRRLIPGADGAGVTVYVGPGRIKEEWVWSDNLALTRICFHSQSSQAVGIRCTVHNRSKYTLNALRLEARLHDPELTARFRDPKTQKEEDDEIFADPRSGILYNRDGTIREESWLAAGWGPESGSITSGEPQDETSAFSGEWKPDTADLLVSLETPAQDLAPGQTHTSVFWLTWGYDRHTVTRYMVNLRRHPGYGRWEEKINASNSQGMTFTCRDPYLTYLFQSVKSWAFWMASLDPFGYPLFSSIAEPGPASPEKAAAGLGGLLAFGRTKAVKKFLDHWLEQRSETPDAAYTLIMAWQYYLLTQDKKWLNENIERIQEVLKYLAGMDRNGDGLPEYDFSQHPSQTWFGLGTGNSRSEIQLAVPAMAAVRAFRSGEKLLKASAGKRSLLAGKYRLLAKQCEQTLSRQYWEPGLGSRGYYAFARLRDQGITIKHRTAGVVEAVLHKVGDTPKQTAILHELWSNSNWRNSGGQYCKMIKDDELDGEEKKIYQRGRIDYRRTHQILMAGFLRPELASQALDRLRRYARAVVLDPQILALPGSSNSSSAGVDLAALNLIDLIVRGLGGLEPDPLGLRVCLPAYTQPLEVELKAFPYHGAKINLRIQEACKGKKDRITVNGRNFKPGGLITKPELSQGRIDIVISRVTKNKVSGRKKSRSTRKAKTKRKRKR